MAEIIKVHKVILSNLKIMVINKPEGWLDKITQIFQNMKLEEQ